MPVSRKNEAGKKKRTFQKNGFKNVKNVTDGVDEYDYKLVKVDSITGREAEKIINDDKHDKDLIILDVREPKDFNNGHLLNAINIPIEDIDKRMDELRNYKSKDIIEALLRRLIMYGLIRYDIEKPYEVSNYDSATDGERIDYYENYGLPRTGCKLILTKTKRGMGFSGCSGATVYGLWLKDEEEQPLLLQFLIIGSDATQTPEFQQVRREK